MYGLNSDFLPRKVAIYARVSTEHDAQLSALGNQVDWYRPILQARPEWTLVAQYIDEGITGTSAEKRPQFMKMIRDAKSKKFDMIITREVSRFARNTVDTLQYTRTLKEYGVEVFFINDNIKTFDGDGELRLTIMATLAQDESRKTSIRVKSGQQTSMEKGVFYGNGNILGYDRVGKTLVINPEQAETVRMIFDMYLSGMGASTIQYELEKRGRLTATGNTSWFASYIVRVLKNSFYCGIITYHKEYTPDYLKQKKIRNNGAVEFVKVQGTHDPIISVEEYERVQQIMAQRTQVVEKDGTKKTMGRRPYSTVWGKLMICQCGKRFNAHFYSRKDRIPGVYYQCYTTTNLGSPTTRQKKGLPLDGTCDSTFLPGWKLDLMANHIFKNYLSNTSETVALAVSVLKNHLKDKEEPLDHCEEKNQLQSELNRLNKKLLNLLEMREEGDIGRDYFRTRKQELDNRIAKINERIECLSTEPEPEPTEDYSLRLGELEKRLQQYTSFSGPTIPDSVVEAFIEKIWVSKDEFRWYLRTDTKNHKDAERVEIASFTLTIDDAKKYLYAISTRKRVFNWRDISVTVWI